MILALQLPTIWLFVRTLELYPCMTESVADIWQSHPSLPSIEGVFVWNLKSLHPYSHEGWWLPAPSMFPVHRLERFADSANASRRARSFPRWSFSGPQSCLS